MRYAFNRFTPAGKDQNKFEIVFSNGEKEEILKVGSLAEDSWCLFDYGEKRALKFYSSFEDLINGISNDLNKEFDEK